MHKPQKLVSVPSAEPGQQNARDGVVASLLCRVPWRLQCVAWPTVVAATKQAAF